MGESTKSVQKDGYEILYKNFKWHVPEYYNFGFDVCDGKRDRYHTFRDLSVESNRYANALRRIGIKKGDRVLVVLQSIPEWYIALIGMFKLGVVPLPGTVLLTSKDVEYRVNRAGACMVLTDLDHADIVDNIKKKCPTLKHLMLVDGKRKGWLNSFEEMDKSSYDLSQDEIGKTKSTDPMLIYFTSGTTGHPKMVLHTHSYPLGHEVTAKFAQALTNQDLLRLVGQKLHGENSLVRCLLVQQLSNGRHLVVLMLMVYFVLWNDTE